MNFVFAVRNSGYNFVHKSDKEEVTDCKEKSGICSPSYKECVCQNWFFLG